MEPQYIREYTKDNETCMGRNVFDVLREGRDSEIDRFFNYDKIVTTYTNLTDFCEYIKNYPTIEDDFIKILYS